MAKNHPSGPLTFAEFRVTFSFFSQFRAFSQSGSLEAAIMLKTQNGKFTLNIYTVSEVRVADC